MALRCFDASARHASFTRAADEVRLTQGAVSHQILGLEAQLGVALFSRGRGGLQLTAAGRAYWAEIAAALRQIERATQNLVTHKGEGGGLHLCIASSFATYWLLPRLGGFVAAHPEVTLNLATRIGPVDFAATPYDAAIEFCDGAAPGLRAALVHPLILFPYAAPALLEQRGGRRRANAAVTADALLALLKRHPLIRHTTVPHAWPGWLARAGLLERVAEGRLGGGPQYDLMSMALSGAIAGLGIALLPAYLAEGAVASGQLHRLSAIDWRAEKAYYLRYPEWKADLAALGSFQRWILDLVQATGGPVAHHKK
jgi:DNA-binding transcriptional LysR family regulator